MIELIELNNKQIEKFKMQYKKATEIDSMLNDLGTMLLKRAGLAMFAITSDTEDRLKMYSRTRLGIGLFRENNLFKFNMER